MEAAARQARFIAERRAFSFDGAWYPAPTWTATKNLPELSSPSTAAIGLLGRQQLRLNDK